MFTLELIEVRRDCFSFIQNRVEPNPIGTFLVRGFDGETSFVTCVLRLNQVKSESIVLVNSSLLVRRGSGTRGTLFFKGEAASKSLLC